MKKIFAISVLSLLAVVAGGDCAFAYATPGGFYTADRIRQEINAATYDKLTSKNIISSNETTTSPDYDAPSVTRMENTVNAAVATKVDNEQVMPAEGSAFVATYANTVQSGGTVETEGDAIVPSVNAVAANFVPSVAKYYDYEVGNFGSDTLEPGDYVLTVSVDAAGNKVYVWRAMNISSDETTVNGYVGPT